MVESMATGCCAPHCDDVFYSSCLDTTKIERLGAAPVQSFLHLIDSITDKEGMMFAVAHLHLYLNALFC